MFVTESWDLLISPISASDTAHYPKITLEDNQYFGAQQMNMGTITISGKTNAYRHRVCYIDGILSLSLSLSLSL